MSIILEALKKVSKEPAGSEEPIKNLPEPEVKGTAIKPVSFPSSNIFKPTLISVSTIFAGGIMLFLLFKASDIQISKTPETLIQAQNSVSAPTQNPPLAAEGYAPAVTAQKQEPVSANIFKIKLPNPKLALNGIIYGIGKPAAIIENKILEEGASIRGAKVVKIYNNKVELLNETSGETFTLKVD